jgi:small subunit ribosomal protein S18
MEQVKRKRFQKRKSCKFCEDKVVAIDYKDVKLIKLYVSERGKIIPRRITGSCAKHQRSLTTSIKRARSIALIPFAAG